MTTPIPMRRSRCGEAGPIEAFSRDMRYTATLKHHDIGPPGVGASDGPLSYATLSRMDRMITALT